MQLGVGCEAQSQVRKGLTFGKVGVGHGVLASAGMSKSTGFANFTGPAGGASRCWLAEIRTMPRVCRHTACLHSARAGSARRTRAAGPVLAARRAQETLCADFGACTSPSGWSLLQTLVRRTIGRTAMGIRLNHRCGSRRTLTGACGRGRESASWWSGVQSVPRRRILRRFGAVVLPRRRQLVGSALPIRVERRGNAAAGTAYRGVGGGAARFTILVKLPPHPGGHPLTVYREPASVIRRSARTRSCRWGDSNGWPKRETQQQLAAIHADFTTAVTTRTSAGPWRRTLDSAFGCTAKESATGIAWQSAAAGRRFARLPRTTPHTSTWRVLFGAPVAPPADTQLSVHSVRRGRYCQRMSKEKSHAF